MPRIARHKKPEKNLEVSTDVKQDRRDFLKTFEKPTQIYRFLKSRYEISPIFLHRNLSYMTDRCSRTNARRKFFKINDMLSCAVSNGRGDENGGRSLDEMRISLVGFYVDPGVDHVNSLPSKCKLVDAEVVIRKTLYKKRKGGSVTSCCERVGNTSVWVNPRHPENYSQESFVVDVRDVRRRDVTARNLTMVFRIFAPRVDDCSSSSDGSSQDSDCDDEKKSLDDESRDTSEISLRNLTSGVRKRRQTITIHERVGEACSFRSESPRGVQARKYRKIKMDKSDEKAPLFESEMAIFDSSGRPLLTSGDYELSLPKQHSESRIRPKNLSWEAIDGGRDIEMLSSMNSAPMLRFKLDWMESAELGPLSHRTSTADDVTRSRPKRTIKLKKAAKPRSDATGGDAVNNCTQVQETRKRAVDSVEYRKWRLQQKSSANLSNSHNGHSTIFFQFMYNSDTQQQTEVRTDLNCPWCMINCLNVYGLVKHLKYCHPRFNFVFSGQNGGNYLLEITLNECYDNSFSGNPHLIYALPGLANGRRGPIKRTSVTETVVSKASKLSAYYCNDITNLLDIDDSRTISNPNSHYGAAGHNRLYFHSGTTLPIRPCEFDEDSEEENDPDWLRCYTERMLDEFTDVNDGEKTLMKLWNLFNLKTGCTADCQMPSSCRLFVDRHHQRIHQLNLRRNLILHFVNLVDFRVIRASDVLTLTQYYDSKIKSLSNGLPDQLDASQLMLLGNRNQRLSVLQSTSYESMKIARLHDIIKKAEKKGDVPFSP